LGLTIRGSTWTPLSASTKGPLVNYRSALRSPVLVRPERLSYMYFGESPVQEDHHSDLTSCNKDLVVRYAHVQWTALVLMTPDPFNERPSTGRNNARKLIEELG